MFELFSLRTNSCCCGISLRTGTIIILIWNLIGSISVALIDYESNNYGRGFWFGPVIFLIIEIIALFGVFKKKPDYLVPHLAIAATILLLLLGIIVLIIMIPFALTIMNNIPYVKPNGKTEHLSDVTTESVAAAILFEIICAAVQFYFFKVVLSHYRELKTVSLDVNPYPSGIIA